MDDCDTIRFGHHKKDIVEGECVSLELVFSTILSLHVCVCHQFAHACFNEWLWDTMCCVFVFVFVFVCVICFHMLVLMND